MPTLLYWTATMCPGSMLWVCMQKSTKQDLCSWLVMERILHKDILRGAEVIVGKQFFGPQGKGVENVGKDKLGCYLLPSTLAEMV